MDDEKMLKIKLIIYIFMIICAIIGGLMGVTLYG